MAPTISQTQLSYCTSGLLAKPAHRLDGRQLLAFRPLRIAQGNLSSQAAAGSASCTLGTGATTTQCSVVISAQVAQDESATSSSIIECNVDIDDAIQQSANVQTLMVTLQKALSQAVQATFCQANDTIEQFTILRQLTAPYTVTRAWKLHIDALINEIGGGNVADVLFAATFAALNNVQLPKTRAISYATGMHEKQSNDGEKMDIFDVRGPLARTQTSTHSSTAQDTKAFKTIDKSRIGVDFEVLDAWQGMWQLQGVETFPVGVTVNVLPSTTTKSNNNNNILLDATQTEEACIPYTRRLLILCQPATKAQQGTSEESTVVGTYMLTTSLETGAHRLGEDVLNDHKTIEQQSIRGTCEFDAIRQAIRLGQQYAKGLHSAIVSQLDQHQS